MSQKFTTHLENFSAGVIAPAWRGRIDTRLPSGGLEDLENFYVLPTGGLRRRPGTKLIAKTKKNLTSVILVPVVLDNHETQILEISPGIIRSYSTGLTETGESRGDLINLVDDTEVLTTGGSLPSFPGLISTSPWDNDQFVSGTSGWTVTDIDGGSNASTYGWTSLYNGSIAVNVTANPSNGTTWGNTGVMLSQSIGTIAPQLFTLTIGANNPGGQTVSGSPETYSSNSWSQGQWAVYITEGAAASIAELESKKVVRIGGNSDLYNAFFLTDSAHYTRYDNIYQELPFLVKIPTGGITSAYIYIIMGINDGEAISAAPAHFSKIVASGTSEKFLGTSALKNIGELQFNQCGGDLYVTGQNMEPTKIYLDGSDYAVSTITHIDGPYCDIGDTLYGGLGTNKTVTTAGGATGATGVTVTASAAIFNTYGDIGRQIRIRPDSNSAWGWGTITAVASATSATITIGSVIANTTTSLEWRLGAWSKTTGFPKVSVCHEQRKIFGGTSYQPQTIWASTAGKETDFAPDDASADENITELTAYTFTIASKHPETIQWLVSKDALLIGTDTQIYTARPSTNESIMSALNVNIKSFISEGCSALQPILANDTLFWVQRYRRQLFEMYYDTGRGRHIARDTMLYADHLCSLDTITSGSYQQYPYKQLYLSTATGALLGLTFNPEVGIQSAWHTHVLGSHSLDPIGAVVEQLISVPGGNTDDVWMVVKRAQENGTSFKTVEVLSGNYSDTDDRMDEIYLDCYSEFEVYDTDGAGTKGFKRISSLKTQEGSGTLRDYNGLVVDVVANGVYLGTTTVQGNEPATYIPSYFEIGDRVAFGWKYTSSALTNTIEPFNNLGNGPAKDQRIYEATFRVQNSLKGSAGYSSATALSFKYPSTIDPTDEASTTYTGDIKFKFPHGWDRDTQVYIQQDEPYPLTISMMLLKMVGGQA